jgi:hypothetical protein
MRFWLSVSIVVYFTLLAFAFLSLSSSFMIHDSFMFMVSNQSLAEADVRRVGFVFCCCLLAFLVALDCAVLAPKVVFSGLFSFCF